MGMNRRSSDDEKMLLLMAEASPSPSKQNMYVVDTRPKVSLERRGMIHGHVGVCVCPSDQCHGE